MSQAELSTLIEHGDEEGCVNLTAFNELIAQLEYDEDQVESLYQELQERGIELRDDCGRATAEPTYVDGSLAASEYRLQPVSCAGWPSDRNSATIARMA